MDTSKRDLIRLEKEKELDKLELEDDKLKFIELIKKEGDKLHNAETYIKQPNKWRVLINRFKDFMFRLDARI